MGCDIHVFCEYRNEETNNKWFNCDWYRRNPLYDKYKKEIKECPDSKDYWEEDKWSILPVFDGRNYKLFGILAGVRDRSEDTISEPRGIPTDISKHTKKKYNYWKSDAHSFTWLRLDEIIDYYDKHNNKHCGYVSRDVAEALDNGSMDPVYWVESLSLLQESEKEDMVYREWEPTCSYLINYFLNNLYTRFDEVFNVYDFYSDAIKDEKRRSYAKNARIVFWFDN